MKQFLVNISNAVGYTLLVLTLISVIIIAIPIALIIYIASLFLVDENGKKKTTTDEIINQFVAKLESYK